MGVKLNNPLMGTEVTACIVRILFTRAMVKLNNPLMGTEVQFEKFQDNSCFYTWLN